MTRPSRCRPVDGHFVCSSRLFSFPKAASGMQVKSNPRFHGKSEQPGLRLVEREQSSLL